MSLNMKSLTQALAKTAAVIEKTVQTTVQEVTGPKALQDFELLDQVGSGGPGLVWKLYLGKPRNKVAHAHNPEVCVWILDKKALADTRLRVGLSKAAEDAFLDVIRADASQLLKLRHPGVLRIVQALDESKAAMSMVTEPIFASVANILGNMENVPVVPKELKGLELGELEIKHGLLQLAETLGFLHNNAQLIHRAISPEAVFLTSSGAWKLASFGYAVNIDQAVTSNTYGKFHYPDYDVEDLVMPLQPQLDYTAPELTRNDGAAQTSSDIFSLACVAYHLLSRQPLVQSKNNLRTYTSIALYLGNENFSKIPYDLSEDLRCMLTPDAFSRPSALDFTGSKFFREDLRLRALRFLDHMLERDNMQKTDFLKALSSMWKEFDARVLRYKVLPPLCAELRNLTMLPMVLPMVLTIAESQEKADFESSTLPALLPVLSSATGDSLLLLVKHAGLLTNKVAAPQMVESIVPMLVRAYDDPDARMQEEVLRRTLSIAKHLDYQVVKQSILPRVHNLALKTTVAAVRVNALMCLGELVQRIDKQALKDVLQTLHRCTAVDHSAPTLMCTLGVATSIYKQYGIEFAAENLLPLLTPLLVAQQLNLQQFTKYMSFIKDILRTIEEKRGIKQGDQESFMADGKQDGQTVKTNGSAGAPSNGSTWDADDWKSITKGQKEAISTSKMGNVAMAGTESAIPLTSSNQQMRPSLNLEWPMPSAGVSSEPGHSSWISEKHVRSSSTGKLSAVNQDFSSWIQEKPVQSSSTEEVHDMEPEDPFANWPPPHSKNLGLGGAFNNAHSMVSQSSQVLSSQSQLNSAPWPSLETNFSSHQTRADPGLAFAASHRESQPSLKLPPPPATGLGKGRGRNPIRPVGQSDTKPSKQAPLMDLLQ